MSQLPDWLPDLILLEEYRGNWSQYIEAVYRYFYEDFVQNPPLYERAPIRLKRHPVSQGKEATFWHLTSEGNDEANRLPDLRRCERIRWPKPIIEHEADSLLKVWANERRGEQRICLWLEQEEYLVVLARRPGYTLLWTAYLVTWPHQKRKLQREYEAFHRN